ncbi:MAG: VWA domain-containing protein, partial [Acidobacteriota bacterium]
MRRRFFAPAAAASILLLLMPPPAAPVGQEPPAEGSSPSPFAFEESVDVRLVQVEARVLDRDGRPITGLGPADFEVLEDGAPVELTFFEEVQPPPRPGRTAGLLRERAGEDDPDGAPAAGTPGAPRHMIFYFDHTGLSVRSQKRALADVEELLDRGQVPAEEVLLLSRNRGSLEVAAPFGSTREELRAVLGTLATERTWGGQAAREKRLMIERFQTILQDERLRSGDGDSPCQAMLARAFPVMRAHEIEVRDRNVAALVQLERAAGLVAGLPGVKALVYISDGLELAPGLDVMRYVERQCPGGQDLANPIGDPAGETLTPGTEPGADLFLALTRRANAHRVTIYSLDAGGLRLGALAGGVETGLVDQSAINDFESANRSNLRDGLSALAERTGGRLLINRNRFTEHLEGVAEEMVRYYSLAYAPPHGGDGGEHRIRIRVPGLSGAEVRYRRTYRDKSAEERLADRLHSAAYLGYVSNPLGIRARAAVSADRSLMVRVTVPLERLQFLPVEGTEEARVVLQAMVRDEAGRT